MLKPDAKTSAPAARKIHNCPTITMVVIGTFPGRLPSVATVDVQGLNCQPHQVAIILDTDDLAPMAPAGSVLIVDPRVKFKPGDRIAVRRIDGAGHLPYILKEITVEKIILHAFQLLDWEKEPSENRFGHGSGINLSEISSILRISGLKYPT